MKVMILVFVLFFNTIFGNAQWHQISLSPSVNTLNSINFIDSKTGYVVGAFGSILRTTDGGDNWVNQSYSNKILNSVFLTDSITVYIVGQGGSIIKTIDGGANWVDKISGISNDLFSIYFTDENTGYAVGFNGNILKTTNGGTAWSLQTSGTSSTLHSIYFIDTLIGYAGGSGVILKTINGGTTWSQQEINASIESICFTDENTGYASGIGSDIYHDNFGVIYKTTNAGISWSRIYYDYSYYWFYSIFFINNSSSYCVGDGPVLKTNDGGITWSKQWITNDIFRDVFFINDSTGFTVTWNGNIYKTINGGENFIENNTNHKSEINISPNPFDNLTTIAFPNPQHKLFTISIIDLFGSIKRIYSNIKNDKIEIYKGNLNKGIYFIEISGEKNYKEKIIVE